MKRVVESMHGDICAEVVYQLTMLECFLEPRSRQNKIMSKASLKQFHVFPKREESVIGRKRTSELHDNASGMTWEATWMCEELSSNTLPNTDYNTKTPHMYVQMSSTPTLTCCLLCLTWRCLKYLGSVDLSVKYHQRHRVEVRRLPRGFVHQISSWLHPSREMWHPLCLGFGG